MGKISFNLIWNTPLLKNWRPHFLGILRYGLLDGYAKGVFMKAEAFFSDGIWVDPTQEFQTESDGGAME